MMELGAGIAGKLEELGSLVRGRLASVGVSDRDKRMLMLGGAAAAVVVALVVLQVLSSLNSGLERQARALRAQLEQVYALRQQYYDTRHRVTRMADAMRPPSQPLLSVIERLLVDERVERGSFSINSREPVAGELYDELSVDVKIQKIALDKVLDVVYRLQSGDTFLRISRFRMATRFDDPNLLDVTFRVSAYNIKGAV